MPTEPGLGVKLNREKLGEYSELYGGWEGIRTIRIRAAGVDADCSERPLGRSEGRPRPDAGIQ